MNSVPEPSHRRASNAGQPPALAAPVTHYENFPVASWLCPPRLRPAIAAIYAFARTADDIADEGDATADQRLQDLVTYRLDLRQTAQNQPSSGRWPAVFGPLGPVLQQFDLPVRLLDDLLDAFMQDVRKTRDGDGYANQTELLDYCRRSANPVGRILLHLYGIDDTDSLAQSDAICSALQLINFWQDLSVDLPRGRFYLPQDRCTALGVDSRHPLPTSETSILIAENLHLTMAMMQKGLKLPKNVPGRSGWELRLVVQGGLRILEKTGRLGVASLQVRPKLTAWDAPLLFWRALWM